MRSFISDGRDVQRQFKTNYHPDPGVQHGFIANYS